MLWTGEGRAGRRDLIGRCGHSPDDHSPALKCSFVACKCSVYESVMMCSGVQAKEVTRRVTWLIRMRGPGTLATQEAGPRSFSTLRDQNEVKLDKSPLDRSHYLPLKVRGYIGD